MATYTLIEKITSLLILHLLKYRKDPHAYAWRSFSCLMEFYPKESEKLPLGDVAVYVNNKYGDVIIVVEVSSYVRSIVLGQSARTNLARCV